MWIAFNTEGDVQSWLDLLEPSIEHPHSIEAIQACIGADALCVIIAGMTITD